MATFKGTRYMTRGVQHEIDLSLQIIMWSMIDEAISKGKKMDYLQIFELKPVNVNGKIRQEIVHKQEVPSRKNTIILDTGNEPISEKIFVIDSDEYVMMLLSNEY